MTPLSYIENMPASFATIRAILGFLAVGFAFLLGRSAFRVYRGARPTLVISWGFRTVAALAGVFWASRTDPIAIAAAALTLLSAGLGCYYQSRPKAEPEDLSALIVPKD
jgi:hypothetical protein